MLLLLVCARYLIYIFTYWLCVTLVELPVLTLQELFSQFSRGRPGREQLRVRLKVATFLASVPPFAYWQVARPK